MKATYVFPAWVYVQESGYLYRPNGTLAWIGYSGHGPGLNEPDHQHVSMVGPIPCGMYTTGTPINSKTMGPLAIPLYPDPENEMFGRTALFMHGDTAAQDFSASTGCIIAAWIIRKEIGQKGIQLRVVARQVDIFHHREA